MIRQPFKIAIVIIVRRRLNTKLRCRMRRWIVVCKNGCLIILVLLLLRILILMIVGMMREGSDEPVVDRRHVTDWRHVVDYAVDKLV